MFTNNLSFQLKPSKIAWFFQFGCYLAFVLLSYSILQWYLSLVIAGLGLVTWYVFAHKPKMIALAQLGHDLWSVQYQQVNQIQQLALKQLVDHHVYIVLYWQEEKAPCVVWIDQLDLHAWKQLKVLARLYRAQMIKTVDDKMVNR
ncbi:hypothetical protein [Acinetobacter sp. MB5]|uniref:hypothetical protein n=1 Tax=Acinetobacter sp. MB5 TaxID=2069438 RepID=UPI000DD01BE8|nr:hypothetical protein [Acinetobacter sp. MB5]